MEMTIAWRRMQKARGHCLQRREATLRQLRLRSLSLSLSLSREFVNLTSKCKWSFDLELS